MHRIEEVRVFDSFRGLLRMPTWLVPIIVVAVLFLRRPEALLRAEFWADDGAFYQAGLDAGAGSLISSYAGYLTLIQRGVVMVEIAVPPVFAPLVGNLASLIAVGLVAAFIASNRMSDVIASARWRAAAGISLALLPAVDRTFGTLAGVQWVIAIYLVAMLVATLPTSPWGRRGDAIGLLFAGLTGPTAAVLLPLYALRAWRVPAARWSLVWVALASAIQLLVYLASHRNTPAGIDVLEAPAVLLQRVLVVPVTGMYGPDWSWSWLLVLGAMVLAWYRLPWRWVAGAIAIAVAFALAGLASTERETGALLDPLNDGRYFLLAGVLTLGLTVVALSRRHWAALPLAALLAVGVLADFRLPAVRTTGWATSADCIGGPEPCALAVEPGPEWTVRWR